MQRIHRHGYFHYEEGAVRLKMGVNDEFYMFVDGQLPDERFVRTHMPELEPLRKAVYRFPDGFPGPVFPVAFGILHGDSVLVRQLVELPKNKRDMELRKFATLLYITEQEAHELLDRLAGAELICPILKEFKERIAPTMHELAERAYRAIEEFEFPPGPMDDEDRPVLHLDGEFLYVMDVQTDRLGPKVFLGPNLVGRLFPDFDAALRAADNLLRQTAKDNPQALVNQHEHLLPELISALYAGPASIEYRRFLHRHFDLLLGTYANVKNVQVNRHLQQQLGWDVTDDWRGAVYIPA